MVSVRDPDREQKIRTARLRGELVDGYDQNYLLRSLEETRASLRRVRAKLATIMRDTADPDGEALAAIDEAEHLL